MVAADICKVLGFPTNAPSQYAKRGMFPAGSWGVIHKNRLTPSDPLLALFTGKTSALMLLTRRPTPTPARRCRDSAILCGGHKELFGCRVPSLLMITKSGLYKLIMRSNKPQAQAFQNWAAANSNNPIIGALKLGVGTTGSQRYLKRLAPDEKMTVTRKTLAQVAGVGGASLGK